MIVIKTDEHKKGVFITESIYTDSLPGHKKRIKEYIENVKDTAKRKGYNVKIEEI